MVNIAQEQALRRWDTLPETLREALFSENISVSLWRASEAEHVPPEKVYTIAKIAGYVLLGFLHSEEVSKELKDHLGLSPETAMNIAKALDSRIFSRIRDDLNRVYAPAGEEPLYAPPKTLEEIRRPTRASEPVVSEGKAIPSPANPIREPGETFEEKPIILHEETEFEPGKPASGFKLEAPPPIFSEEKFTPAVRPARLEIGGEPVSTPTPPQPKPPAEAPKMVNYTDLRTPLMSPEQELPAPPKWEPAPPAPTFRPSYSPPQPAKEVNIRADQIKITVEKPPPPFEPMPIQKKRRGFWGWLKSLFSRKPQKEIIFAPKVISEEELKREALTIRASMPKSPPPPAGGSRPTPAPQPTYAPRQSEPPKPPQPPPAGGPRPTRGPSVFEEVVDLSTFTKTKKPFPPPDSGSPSDNTVNLKPSAEGGSASGGKT